MAIYRDNYPHNIEAPQRVYVQYSQDINFDYSGGKYPLGETFEGFIWETIYNPIPHYIGSNLIGRHVWMRWRIGEKENWTLPMRLTDSILNIETSTIEYTENPSQIKFKFKYTLNTGEVIYSEYMYLPMPKDGIGIASSQILNNNLYLTYSDGTIHNVGRVVGYDGNGFPSAETHPGEIPYIDGDGNIVWVSLTDLAIDIIDSYIIGTAPITVTSGVIAHLDTDGNKHIPVGGISDDILTTNGTGTYTWKSLDTLVTTYIGDIITTISGSLIDDSSGSGDIDVTWSANKLVTMFGTINTFGIKYAVADLTTLAAITGMAENEQAVVESNRYVYKYNGASWIQFFALDGPHNHNDLYYTKSETNSLLSNITIDWSQINNIPNINADWKIIHFTELTEYTVNNTSPLYILGGGGTDVNYLGSNLIRIDSSDYSAGSGISISNPSYLQKVVSHADTSSINNTSNTDRFVIQNLTFDTFGHVQTISSVNLASSFGQTLTRGLGLTGNNYNGSAGTTWNIDFAGTGSANTVARSDHGHTTLPTVSYTAFTLSPLFAYSECKASKVTYTGFSIVTITMFASGTFAIGAFTSFGSLPTGYLPVNAIAVPFWYLGTDGTTNYTGQLRIEYDGGIWVGRNTVYGALAMMSASFSFMI